MATLHAPVAVGTAADVNAKAPHQRRLHRQLFPDIAGPRAGPAAARDSADSPVAAVRHTFRRPGAAGADAHADRRRLRVCGRAGADVVVACRDISTNILECRARFSSFRRVHGELLNS